MVEDQFFSDLNYSLFRVSMPQLFSFFFKSLYHLLLDQESNVLVQFFDHKMNWVQLHTYITSLVMIVLVWYADLNFNVLVISF